MNTAVSIGLLTRLSERIASHGLLKTKEEKVKSGWKAPRLKTARKGSFEAGVGRHSWPEQRLFAARVANSL